MTRPDRRSLLLRAGLLGVVTAGWPISAAARQGDWAQPVLPPPAGLPNLYQVTPLLFRAAQPEAQGFDRMAQLGIRSALSLRQTVDDRALAQGSGVAVMRVPMKARHVGEDHGARIVLAMRSLRAAMTDGPVLVHCHHGADRTGVICALWRMLYQGWSRSDASDELINGGFGFHRIWANIPRYLATVDLNALRAGIETGA
ncbi:dual specificity protein phosphatase family protein [Fuscibacter oryzae]|uniref:Tyrosine-protein phosphatase n=1 Tax=Fuscibacter oryzae TaxID=2803939 RepID=A0A8J7MN78_9RHOB|nr:dual specificity protein phosphatase family protein [Fuscibacter oryzae]MBL4927960.1 tyrosine-protein phosphatase [Fuscibacter oryzae]